MLVLLLSLGLLLSTAGDTGKQQIDVVRPGDLGTFGPWAAWDVFFFFFFLLAIRRRSRVPSKMGTEALVSFLFLSAPCYAAVRRPDHRWTLVDSGASSLHACSPGATPARPGRCCFLAPIFCYPLADMHSCNSCTPRTQTHTHHTHTFYSRGSDSWRLLRQQ